MNEEELRKRLEERGWKLRKVVRFKRHDRIVAERPGITVTYYLRKKLDDFSWDELQHLFKPVKGASN